MSVMFGKVSENMAEVGVWGMLARIPVLHDMAVYREWTGGNHVAADPELTVVTREDQSVDAAIARNWVN
jgi:hypothetical protein